VGLGNYETLWRDRVFWLSLRNTLAYVLVVVPATVALGLGVALLINAGRSLSAFYRAAHFLPVMATLVATAMTWEVILHPTIGLLNQLLAPLGFGATNWLKDPATVLPVLCVIGIWEQLGFTMVLFLAGLAAIPRDLNDAADIDGADHPYDRFVTVTWPLLGPVTMFVLVVTAIRAFKVFDTVAVLTQGGPNKQSEMLLYSIYSEGFLFLRSGYASALTVVFLIIILGLTLAQVRGLDRRTHYA
jgi:multiple sugar transport system permease protein